MNARSIPVLAAPALAALALAACGGGSSGNVAGSGSTQSVSAASISTHSTSLGTVLANSSGKTLYILTSDKPGKTACTGPCLALWPPVVVSGTPSAANAVTAQLGTFDRSGTKQATANGMPLYTYAGDSAPGDVNGQGIQSFGGTWYAVMANGSPVTSSSGTSTSPSSSSTGGGYNY